MKLLTREDIPEDAITVSPSQITSYQRCAYKWYLTKKEGKQELITVTEKMSLGTIFHKLLENYYKRFIGGPVGLLNSDELAKMMEETQAENGWTDYESQLLFFNAYTIFITYMNWALRKEKLIPLGAEVETFAPTGLISTFQTGRRPIYLHGILDLVAERDGTLGVVDHKTHTRRPWTDKSILFDTQCLFYPLLLSLQDVPVEWAMISTMDMFLPKKDLHASLQREERFERFIIKQTKVNLGRYTEELYKTIRQLWCNPGMEYPRRLDKNCSGCGFNELCGMHIRGYNIEGLIESKYTPTTLTAKEFDASELLDVHGGSADPSSYPVLDG